MFTRLFWKDAAERAIKTFAQTLGALLLTVAATSLIALDWPVLLGVAGTSAVISLCTSIGGNAVTSNVPTVSPASIAKDDRGI